MYTQLAGDVTWWESLLFSYTKLSYLGEHSEVISAVIARVLNKNAVSWQTRNNRKLPKHKHGQNAKIHQILSSIYSGVQFVCLYLVSLFDFISAVKLRYAKNNEISARSTCHVSRERAVLGLIALRKHDTQQSHLCKKVPSLTYML